MPIKIMKRGKILTGSACLAQIVMRISPCSFSRQFLFCFSSGKKKKMRWCFIMFWWKDNRNDIRRPWPAPRNPLRWCFKKDEKVGNHQLVEANRSVAATVTNSCEITNIRCWPPHAWPSLSLIFGKDFSLISIYSKLLSLDHYLPSIPIDVNFRSWVI